MNLYKSILPVDERGFYGEFGGSFVPPELQKNIDELQEAYLRYVDDPEFQKEFNDLLRDYVGRPSPLYFAPRLSEKYGTNVYLKREDLNQQRHRAGTFSQAHGQKANHCRDRRRPARRGNSHSLRLDGLGMLRLYGRTGYSASKTER